MTDDFALVQRVLRRDPSALELLIERLGCVPRMLAARNAAHGALLRDVDLVDLGHDVLTKIWEQLPHYRGEAVLETWAHRFCEYALMNAIRRRRRAPPPLPEDAVAPMADRGHLEPTELDQVHRALARLPDDDAEIVRRRHFHDESFDAIAARTGAPTPTIKSRYYRSLQKLRFWLQPRFGEVT